MVNSEKQDALALLAELDKMQCGEHVIMSKSTEHYVKRQAIAIKSNHRRYLYILLFVIYTFRGSILSFYQQDWIISLTGDYAHVMGNTTLISRLIILTSSCVLIFIIYSHYMENRFQLTQIDTIFDMIGGKQDFKLMDRYRTKFIGRSLFVCKLINTYYYKMQIPSDIMHSLLALVAYLSTTLEQNLPILCLNAFCNIIWLRHSVSMLYTLVMWSFIIIEFMKWKFQSIIDMISSNIFLINEGIHKYNKMYIIMSKITKPMNTFISILYIFFPIYYSCALNIAFDNMTSKFGTLLTIILALMVFSGNYMSFLLLSSISNTNHLFLKYLYSLLIDNNFNQRVLRRRIDSFIARLNIEFIGFLCLSLMKFESSSFYEYLIGLSSTYFLISINNNYNVIRVFKMN